jgi:sulfoxide reductase heme-binding subunit YedZ
VPALVAGAAVPLISLAVKAARGALGANPVEQVLNQLGLIALVFLVATLACTPLRLLTGWTWPARVRRTLGLLAFAYAALHVVFYAGVDQGLNLAAIAKDVVTRKFQLVGFAAFLTLLPLALTSTAASVRRLGFARWQRLHRLSYLAAGLGALHFWLKVKRDVTEPAVYAAVLGVLLAARAYRAVRRP